MLRKITSVVLAVVVAIILVSLVEMVGHRIWPPPTGLDPTNPESVRTAMAQMPLGALASVAVAWIVGAFGGGWLGSRVARQAWPAYVVGGVVMLASIASLVMLPHPAWFWVVALVLVPLAAHLGGKLGSGPAFPAAPEVNT